MRESLSKAREQLTALRKRYEIDVKRDFHRFLQLEILSRDLRAKQFIVETLERKYGWRVERTKPLFRFDELNKTNFHKYVDGYENILAVIQLSSGGLLACFTTTAFAPGNKGNDGIIMVIQNEECFHLKEGCRAITYDDFYLIFGNSEIRIKSGEKSIFSNFGISNGYYECRNKTVDALFSEGKNKNEVPIEGYEIYQILPSYE